MAFVSTVPLGVFRTTQQSTSRLRIQPSACTSSPSSNITELSTLRAAVAGYVDGGRRPGASEVGKALEATARKAKKKDLNCDILRTRRWRLVFTGSQSGLFRDLYFPFHTEATWTEDRFINTVLLGPFTFQISGPGRWVPPRLEFTFCDAEISIGSLRKQFNNLDPKGSTLEGRTAKELPFFLFMYADNDIAIARGRGGGLAVWASIQ